MQWNVREQNVAHTLLTCGQPRLNQAVMTSSPLICPTWHPRQVFGEFHRSANGWPITYRNAVLPPLFILVREARRINDNQAKFRGDMYNSIEWPKVRNITLYGELGEAS